MSITYRMLELAEWEKVYPLYTFLFPGRPIPTDPSSSCVAVAEKDGKVVGFWFMHLCMHAEPVGVDPVDGQGVNLFALRDTLHKAFSTNKGMEYYITAEDSRIGDILEENGLKPMGVLFSGQIP